MLRNFLRPPSQTAYGAREASQPRQASPCAGGAAAGMNPRLPQPVLVIVVNLLDQRQGRHLLVPEQVRRLELNGFGLAPRGKDHRFVPEHLLIDIQRCAQQRAKRRQSAQLEAWKVPEQFLFGGKPGMTIAYRCLDEVHVEAAGCRDRHQGIAARGAHRDRLEDLAGIDAERLRLVDRGVGLRVRDGLERDTVGSEMLRYLRHHPAPKSLRGTEHNADTPPRPRAVTGPAARYGA